MKGEIAMGWMLMPLKRYADFSGRSRRMEYWMWQVFKLIVGIVFMTVFMVMFGAAFASFGATKDPSQLMALAGGALLLWMIYMLFALAIIIPDIAVAVRRLHDTNRTGWWIVAPLATYLIGLVAMVATAGVGAGMGEGDQVGTGMLAAGGIIALVTGLATLALGVTLLVFLFLDGTAGMNRYGPDPKGRDASQVFA
jgi:uncharacterized membrane protein YhaH (DUF805 family)